MPSQVIYRIGLDILTEMSEQPFELPADARVVHVGRKSNTDLQNIEVWLICTPDMAECAHFFRVVVTGQPFDCELWQHVGTVADVRIPFVFHVLKNVHG